MKINTIVGNNLESSFRSSLLSAAVRCEESKMLAFESVSSLDPVCTSLLCDDTSSTVVATRVSCLFVSDSIVSELGDADRCPPWGIGEIWVPVSRPDFMEKC
jgi:hypothetical protein